MKRLIIRTRLIGLDSKTINLCYQKGDLELLDQQTIKYQNKINFFEQEKRNIQRNIKNHEQEYQINIPPIDIALDCSTKSPIYIEEDSKKISPLFQSIQANGKSIPLHEFLYPIFKAKIKTLYQLDKENCKNGEYISLFLGLEPRILEQLEFGMLTELDYRRIYRFLNQSSRFTSIARYLLSNIWSIPLKGCNPLENRNTEFSRKLKDNYSNTYRSPYKE